MVMGAQLPGVRRSGDQLLADLCEDLALVRYPTRVRLLQTIDEAARRAQSLARLEYALLTHR